ncbi:Piso0_002141 [Millerozyma farinosa CBS 7064]|uniref:tRNA ligase n=1 Tax=Pichia sorbitophila (strain ATCC MYA-4447 / BCRC 22081 / CBS 7064 / NBRC 10061 / NRRL Y-12695) TaxID=559304 RepID=G8YBT5_PICSO|nr:Piso0_002141 [Millerozyma farinosa CBS 7064]
MTVKLPDPIYDSQEAVEKLLQELEVRTTYRKEGKVAKFTNKVNDSDIEVTSWRFSEWDYEKERVKLPCNARGLFTSNGRICVRGYDKFFAVDEVPKTMHSSLSENSVGPYEVSTKENGCIILISGLENGELVVCSKHSTGKRDFSGRNHALQGEAALEKQLQTVGKTRRDLAELLYCHNLTAVAELCDDEFEEHVLSYSRDQAGLYLHGLNYNTIQFRTLPFDLVEQFTNDWGFSRVHHFTIDTFEDLWKFLQETAKSGIYDNREVEGFVVRCREKDINHNFFFKFKFEEPYLLYRKFREVTRTYLEKEMTPQTIMTYLVKDHKRPILFYLEFMERFFKENPQAKEEFLQGHGIIKLRKLFLKEMGFGELDGIGLMNFEGFNQMFSVLSLEPSRYKYVLIPIATIGCGKTTVFRTLNELFPNWSHVQNDDIPKVPSKSRLVDSCLTELAKPDVDVVLCDRNNHVFRERAQLFDQFLALKENFLPADIGLKFVAVNFVKSDLTKDKLWDITLSRVSKRGNNHQSIKFSDDEEHAMSVMKGFVGRFKYLDTSVEPDSLFDDVIEMDIENKDFSFNNTKKIIQELSKFPELQKAGIDKIDDSKLESAFQKALSYVPTFTKTFRNSKPSNKKKNKKAGSNKTEKKKKIVYFGVRIDFELVKEALSKVLTGNETWESLNDNKRVQDEFHLTLSHLSSTRDKEAGKHWTKLSKLFEATSDQLKNQDNKSDIHYLDFFCDVKLTRVVVAKSSLICIEAEIIKSTDSSGKEVDISSGNRFSHITVGTTSPDIKPVKSNHILEILHIRHGNDLPNGEYDIDLPAQVYAMPDNYICKGMRCFAHF